MKKIMFWLLAVLLLAAAVWLAIERFSLFAEKTAVPSGQPGGYRIETVAEGLDTPWDIAFTDQNRMLISERPGRIRVIESGRLQQVPLHIFPNVSETAEGGLMSIALDPKYKENGFMYVSYVYEEGDLYLRVSRLTDEGTSLTNETVIIDRIPAANVHAGSRVRFGPDGKLYITTGDAAERALAQETGSLAGKILRLNPDGSIPEDNPSFGSDKGPSAIWSYGHRNPQGLAWHPETNELYEAEHGPSVFDGPAGGDEINRIVRGGNYGWPLVSHDERKEGTIAPLITFTPAEAPASALFYSGDALLQFKGSLFLGALRGRGLLRVVLDKNDPDRIDSYEKLADVDFGRIRALAEGPDGYLYFSTSNNDGRGDPAPADDRIMRLAPRDATARESDVPDRIEATFVCSEGKTISAIFNTRTRQVELSLSDGRSLTLPQAMSASGARYATADEQFVFWNKGDGAFIDEGENMTYADCVLAH